VLNKSDLGTADEAGVLLADYGRAGYPGHLVSAHTGAGIDELLHACRGRRSLFVGHSGVGKSSLLNAMVAGARTARGALNA
jgi:ribosome biogenesis GTPase